MTVAILIWQRDNPRERFWAARTRQLHGTHMNELDRMRSTLPYHRPLATVIRDTVGYGRDEEGGVVTTCWEHGAILTSARSSRATRSTITAIRTWYGLSHRTALLSTMSTTSSTCSR